MTARLLLALALLALPGTAMADPISIFAAVLSATGSAFVAGVVATVASYSAYILVAANYIYGGMDARRRARNQAGDARRAHNAGLQDRNASVLQADPPWRVVYGACRTGGDIVAIFTSDKTGTRTDGSSYTKPDAYKHLVVVVAAHEVDDITEMYIDGVAVGALDANRWATTGDLAKAVTINQERRIEPGAAVTFAGPVTVLSADDANGSMNEGGWTGATPSYTVSGATVTNTSGSIALGVRLTYISSPGSVRWGKQLGTTTQAVDSYLTGAVPAQWTASDRLRGLAYVVVTLDLEDQRFQGGPPQMAWDVRGRKVYDPRTSATGWSANPALIVRDYLTAPWGFECAAGEIDDSYTIAAANACDVSISLTEGATTTSGATYTCNGALLSSDSRERVLNDLCDSMAGYAVYGARWQVMAGAWTAPVMALTDADLAGQIEIVQAGVSLDEVFNGVRGGYVPAGAGVNSDFTYANATFVAADGRELWTEVSLPYTNSAARCRNMARVMVEANRDSQVIRMPCTLRAWPLQVGDRVTVTSAEYGFVAKAYRVTDWAFGLQTPVMLTLQEDGAAIYDLADAATSDPAPNTDLPSPWMVGPVTGWAATSGDTNLLIRADGTLNVRVRVTWAPIASAYVANGAGRVEVRWRSPRARSIGGTVYPGDAADVWHVVTVPGDMVEAYINAAVPGDRIVIAVVVINGLGARSDARFIGHTVSGRAALVPWAQVSGAGRPADNATVGAAWGSNLTGQPADSALLNALQTWAQVSGAGRPADNATVGAAFGTNITGTASTADIGLDQVTVPRTNTITTAISAAYQSYECYVNPITSATECAYYTRYYASVELMSYVFSMPNAGKGILLWQGLAGGLSNTNIYMSVNGTTIGRSRMGNAYDDSPMIVGFADIVAGSNTVRVWGNDTGAATIHEQRLVVLGAQR